MNRPVLIQELARQELVEAAFWYRERNPDAARAFIAEIQQLADHIRTFPKMFAEIEPNIRRCPLNNFPYSLLYVIEEECVTIFAVMHQHRHPNYWQEQKRT